ncbi:cytochrome c oxidase subunit 3 [Marinobacterium arenosum]|uniref:cytochrome c oxidase subunit 3 n=1 Tax=Marinobacterium arenosum TaxID=2862496 RepID=UPI001C94C3DE|nr:cytochrome c oxidase subunit 3 [Marinobacterium arenosum]MBY4675045.1 cytochrome c oxidase subunit 3 [Marinobacterium arenosum]
MNTLQFRVTDNGADGGHMPDPAARERLRGRIYRTGLWLLLMVISSLFLLFLIAFIARAQLPDWQSLVGSGAPLADNWPLWLTSALLLCASLALQWAKTAAQHGLASLCRASFLLGGLFALSFLAGQLWVWQRFVEDGYLVSGNPANSFFYLLTGLHGLHLIGGLVGWTVIAARLFGRQHSLQPLAIELCTRYWHFLLGLWLLLFLVLTRSQETYQAIAAFCGLR